MANSSRRRFPVFRFLLGLVVCGFLFFRWSNTALRVTRWDAGFPDLPEGFDGCRIAVLSDLHGAVFGRDNAALFRAVERLEPEFIFFLGDLEDSFRGPVPGYAEQTARGLSAIAPSYYITGNHEWAIGSVPELKARLAGNGMTVLSNEITELKREGGTLILAGIDDPNGYAEQRTPEAVAAEVYARYGDGAFWFLLAHRNDRFPVQYSLLGADMVFSGHGHGGLIRLPFTDGLVSVNRTLFPSWTAGFYEANGSRLFVTRGLGNSGRTFRLFNRPEIALITLSRPES